MDHSAQSDSVVYSRHSDTSTFTRLSDILAERVSTSRFVSRVFGGRQWPASAAGNRGILGPGQSPGTRDLTRRVRTARRAT
jgi:hypothetical protein